MVYTNSKAPPTCSTGQPIVRAPVSAFGGPVVSYLSPQHERLMLELLPFKDGSQFREWLVLLQGDWDEFYNDYFVHHLDEPETDKTATAQAAKEAMSSRSAKFLIFHPGKKDWTAQDHAVRFMVTAISDSLLHGTWSDSEWRRRTVDISRAMFEVLSFLRASELAKMQQEQEQQEPPQYSDNQ